MRTFFVSCSICGLVSVGCIFTGTHFVSDTHFCHRVGRLMWKMHPPNLLVLPLNEAVLILWFFWLISYTNFRHVLFGLMLPPVLVLMFLFDSRSHVHPPIIGGFIDIFSSCYSNKGSIDVLNLGVVVLVIRGLVAEVSIFDNLARLFRLMMY